MSAAAEIADRGPGRVALVLARHAAVGPPGIDPLAFADAALADTYEVLSELVDVTAGIVGGAPDAVADLLWPSDLGFPELGPAAVVHRLAKGSGPGGADNAVGQCVLVAADVPDLPGLVLAKVFRALGRADVVLAPARGEPGRLVALGVRVPWPAWVPDDLDLDDVDPEALVALAPRRTAIAVGPDWHRLTSPGQTDRLDPGLEGWDNVRLVLAGARPRRSSPVPDDAG
ncbi:MAG: hypothetical protein ACR2LI_05260 [Propionibacteriaceae bacterium]